uniref:ATP synthase complex subunit 8 n=1 Tax=Cressida cressida TaxID=95570 RepID=A0A5J6WCC4_9NEOP|nr:ATP synthase F0 subunit 8 [Cressida cressida]
MPQMMPINWIFYFFYFICILILVNIFNFYLINFNNSPNNSIFIKKKKLPWKW